MTSGNPNPGTQDRPPDDTDRIPPAVGVYDRPKSTFGSRQGLMMGIIALIVIVALLAVALFVFVL